MRRICAVSLAACIAAACGPSQPTPASLKSIRTEPRPQTEREAWSAFCNMTDDHKFFRTAVNKRDAHINETIRRVVRHKGVRTTVLPAGDAGGLPRVAKLRAAVKAAGMTACPFVDYRERDVLSQRCNDTGDSKLCYRVGELYAKQKIYPSEEHVKAPAYFERACVNGSTAACARRAEWSGGEVKWLERACRRGHKPSCARLAVDKPKAPQAKLIKSEPVTSDDVIKKVKSVYLPSVVDCFEAFAQTRSTKSKGRLAFAFTISKHGVVAVKTKAFEGSVKDCLDRQVKRWVFRGAKPESRYKFCYELEGKSMISRRLPPLGNLLAAPGPRPRRTTGPVFGQSRRVRVARRAPRRRRYWARVSVYYGRYTGVRTTLSKYTVRNTLNKRLYYLARCFQRHVMGPRRYRYMYAYAYMNLTIGPKGQVTSAGVYRTTRYAHKKKWQRCLEKEVKRTTFPVPKTRSARQPTSASFTNLRFYFSTTTSRPYRPEVCDFDEL